MKTKGLSIVELARKRYDESKEYWFASKLRSKKDIEFSFGDPYNGYQYPECDRSSIDKKGLITLNIVEPACKKIINAVRMNRPQAKIEPADGNASPEAADVVERWSRGVKSKANIDDATDQALEDQTRGGEGYFELCLEYEDEFSFKKAPKIRYLNYETVWRDVNIKSQDGTDSEWDFIEEEISLEQAEREHKGIDPSNWSSDTLYTHSWVKKDTVIRCKYYYCEYKEETLYQYTDGTTGLSDEGKEVALDDDGKPVKRKTYIKEWWYCLLLGGEEKPVHRERWHGSTSPIFGVYGQLYYENGLPYYKGETRNMIDVNKSVNYFSSKIVKTVAKQQDAPWLGSLEAIGGANKAAWDEAAKGNTPQMYTFSAYTDDGKPLPTPQRIPPPSSDNAAMQGLQLFLEQGQNVTGQFSVPGQHAKDTSGIAMQRKNMDSELATYHFQDNLGRALRALESRLVELFPTLVEEKEIIRLMGVDGTEENAQITKAIDTPYAEPPNKDNAYGVKHWINPDLLGKLDVTITIGPSYKTLKSENADRTIDMTNKNPALWQTCPDLIVDSLDLPNKEAWMDRLRKTLPPGIIDEGGGEEQIPAQIKQQLEQQTMQLENAMSQVTQLEEENRALQQKVAEEQAKCITERIQAKTYQLNQVEQKLANPIVEKESNPIVDEDEEEMVDPRMDEIIYSIEESGIRQAEATERLAEAMLKPKVSTITITSPTGKVYTAEKIEQ